MNSIVVNAVSFGYPGARVSSASYGPHGFREALRGVDLRVLSGSLTAIVGPNGSGKSTLLKVISAYLHPASGSVTLCGKDIHALPSAERAALVTYCGDEPEPAFEFSVEETVLLGRVSRGSGPQDSAAAMEAMRRVGVEDLRKRVITSLSSGERQRVYLARAVFQDPKVLLLDEPTAHLDMAYELQVMEMVGDMTASGKTVLTVVHDLNLALRFASRILFMRDGSVVRDLLPSEVDAHAVREVYGVDACISTHPVLGCPVALPTSRA